MSGNSSLRPPCQVTRNREPSQTTTSFSSDSGTRANAFTEDARRYILRVRLPVRRTAPVRGTSGDPFSGPQASMRHQRGGQSGAADKHAAIWAHLCKRSASVSCCPFMTEPGEPHQLETHAAPASNGEVSSKRSEIGDGGGRNWTRIRAIFVGLVIVSVLSVICGVYELSSESPFVREHRLGLLAFLGGLYVLSVVAAWAVWPAEASAKNAPPPETTTASLALDRFKKRLALVLLPAVGSLVLGLLSFSFQEHKAREALLVQRMNTAANVSETLAKFRSALVQFGSLCSPGALASIPREISGTVGSDGRPDCLGLIQDLEALWTDTSWRFAMRIQDVLSASACTEAKRSDDECAVPCEKIPERCYVAKACAKLREASMDFVSLEYRRLINAIVSYRNGQLACPNAIGPLISKLSKRSRDLGCALQVAGYPPRGGGIPSSYCRAALRDHDWCEPEKDWRTSEGEVDKLQWEAWWTVANCPARRTATVPAAAPRPEPSQVVQADQGGAKRSAPRPAATN